MISLRKLLPTWAIPNGGRVRADVQADRPSERALEPDLVTGCPHDSI
ncbi:MAG: hypothetical protein ACLP8S_24075 [Solirubrobacteraceae bacterium]